MNKTVKLALEGAIITSTMIATNEVVTYHVNPYRKQALTSLSCNVASGAVGYFIGRKVSSFIVDSIEDAINAYNTEVIK